MSVQPIVAEDKTGFFTRLGCFLEEKIEREISLKKYKLLALGCALLLGMSCCLTGMYHPGEHRGYFKETDRTTGRDKKAETQDINDVHLRDKDSLYENDDETSVVTMYLTVSPEILQRNGSHLEGDQQLFGL